MKTLVLSAVLLLSSLTAFSFAAEGEFKGKNAPLDSWLTISGEYQFRYDYLQGKIPNSYLALPDFSGAFAALPGFVALPNGLTAMPNPAARVENSNLYSNKFGLNLKAKATQDISVTARLLMYKFAGMQDDSPLHMANGTAFSFDRAGVFDGTVGHVPSDNKLAVDRLYATWNNIAEQPIWFSIGRRPSTDGAPLHLKLNKEKPGNSGVPALLINYAFDGVTLGYAPDVEALPGAYAKICYGRGFSNGIKDTENGNGLHNMDLIGLNVVPFDTDALRVELQYNHAMNIFSNPQMLTGAFAPLMKGPNTNLGNADFYGLQFLGKVKNVGTGDLNWFVAGAMSRTDANGNTLVLTNPMDPTGMDKINTGAGLLWGGMGGPKNETGWTAYVGGRYDYNPTKTKLGLEFNHGSKNWFTFAPAEEDMWTSKVGTRGNVYEAYVIQELPLKPVSSYLSKAFFRVGYQYYDFDYTGSNSWIGPATKIADLNNSMAAQFTSPLKNAQDIYATFEVHF